LKINSHFKISQRDKFCKTLCVHGDLSGTVPEFGLSLNEKQKLNLPLIKSKTLLAAMKIYQDLYNLTFKQIFIDSDSGKKAFNA